MSTDVAPTGVDLADYVIGEILSTMGRRRISSAALGRLVGEPNYWVLRRLNRRIPINLDDVQRIATALGVSVSALLPGAGGLPAGTTDGEPHEPIDPLAARVVATVGDVTDRPRFRPPKVHRRLNATGVVRDRPATRTPK